MRSFALGSFVLLAGCVSAPQPIQPPVQLPTLPPAQQQVQGPIIGLTGAELVQRLGTPVLQIREGNSLKLQFRGRFCVLDAYLYPPAGAAGPYRVTHVDTRTRALAPIDQATCLSTLQGA